MNDTNKRISNKKCIVIRLSIQNTTKFFSHAHEDDTNKRIILRVTYCYTFSNLEHDLVFLILFTIKTLGCDKTTGLVFRIRPTYKQTRHTSEHD